MTQVTRQPPMRTRDKLAAELRKIAAIASADHAAKYEAFAKRAETGEFDDYADTYVCPITQLYTELTAVGFTKFAARVANGEFDATKEESDEWARSPSGQEAAEKIGEEWARDMTTQEIKAELMMLGKKWDDFHGSLEGMSGSPGEWIVERMDELETELKRRTRK